MVNVSFFIVTKEKTREKEKTHKRITLVKSKESIQNQRRITLRTRWVATHTHTNSGPRFGLAQLDMLTAINKIKSLFFLLWFSVCLKRHFGFFFVKLCSQCSLSHTSSILGAGRRRRRRRRSNHKTIIHKSNIPLLKSVLSFARFASWSHLKDTEKIEYNQINMIIR